MTGLTRYANIELLELPDCDGLLENGKCKWLRVPSCTGSKCTYYHKKKSQDKAYQRLRSLEEEKQSHIAKKYYGGKRPWAVNEKPDKK